MKKLDFEDFQKRTKAVAEARKIFMPHVTDNITVAFEMYQQLLEENERQEVLISTQEGGRNVSEQQGRLLGPNCPDCNKTMGLIPRVKDIDGKEWASAWRCTSCAAMFYNEKDVNEIYDELLREKYGDRQK